jgi:hypothetical protein
MLTGRSYRRLRMLGFMATYLVIAMGCRHDVVVPKNADYRIPFYGEMRFTVLTTTWMMGQPTTTSTTVFDGEVRSFYPADSANDFYVEDDSAEDPDRKITIAFIPQGHITSLLEEDGTMVGKTGYHYGHSGGFDHPDTLRFTVGGLGGLGGGTNYSVVGVRR